jgi:hypothetical protein
MVEEEPQRAEEAKRREGPDPCVCVCVGVPPRTDTASLHFAPNSVKAA